MNIKDISNHFKPIASWITLATVVLILFSVKLEVINILIAIIVSYSIIALISQKKISLIIVPYIVTILIPIFFHPQLSKNISPTAQFGLTLTLWAIILLALLIPVNRFITKHQAKEKGER